MNISSVDLNLLLVLHAVLREGSATAAAKKLHVTQSAVSNSLGRLRSMLGDPLVVRSGRRGLVPTPRALELAPSLEEALEKLRTVIEAGRGFDPLACKRQFTIASSDSELLVDLPRVAALFSKRLPSASLRAVSIDYLMTSDGLMTGEIDLVMGYAKAMQPGWHSRPLYVDSAVLVVRRDHPSIGDRITRAQFASHPHVDVHVQLGGPGAGNRDARRAMGRAQLQRPVRLVVPSFTAAALAAAQADYIAGLPRRLAKLFCSHLPLRMVEMPMPDLCFPAAVAWHPRTHADAAVSYVRNLVIEALADPPATAPGSRKSRPARSPGRKAERRRA